MKLVLGVAFLFFLPAVILVLASMPLDILIKSYAMAIGLGIVVALLLRVDAGKERRREEPEAGERPADGQPVA